MWKLLLGYYSPNKDLWASSVARKKEDYMDCSRTHFPNLTYYEDSKESSTVSEEMNTSEEQHYKQILIDVKRTNPSEAFSSKVAKDMLTRVLFVWSCKHPTSGYVQGMNDLAATFMDVFLAEAVDISRKEHEGKSNDEVDHNKNAYDLTFDDMQLLKDDQIISIEVDTYFCLENFLKTLQENYTDKQPGVYKVLK